MTNLILNEPAQPYKPFLGSTIEQMPKLIEEGRVPISIAGLMQRRLDVLNSDVSQSVRDEWWNTPYVNTGDAAAYDMKGNMKVVLDAQHLRELTPNSNLQNGALILPEGTYTDLQGSNVAEFTKEQLTQYTRKWLTKGQSVDNPIWLAFARGDTALLSEYGDAAFARAKEFGYDTTMCIFPALPKDKETMQLWCLGKTYYNQSYAIGDSSLDDYDSRLVGVAPKAQILQKIASPNESAIVAPTLEEVLALRR